MKLSRYRVVDRKQEVSGEKRRFDPLRYGSRKFLFTLVFVVIADVLKFRGQLGDMWFCLANVGAIIGYGAVNVWGDRHNHSPREDGGTDGPR